MDSETKHETLTLLRNADPSNPLARAVRSYIEDAPTQSQADLNLYFRVRAALFKVYTRIALHRWFTPVLIVLLAVFTVVQLAAVVVLILADFVFDLQSVSLSFSEWAHIGSVSASAALVAVGITRLRRSRLSAYRWFQRSVLVSIFVTQIFAFFVMEFAALSGLAFDILIYTALVLMIEREQATTL